MDSPSDLRVLNTILKEQGIELPEQQLSLFSEEEMAQMIKKDTGIDIRTIDSEKELERVFNAYNQNYYGYGSFSSSHRREDENINMMLFAMSEV